MKKTAKLIVSIVGEFPYYCYLDLRAKYFPSPSQKKASQIEKEELERSIKFYSAFIKPGDLCFDVGANMGNRVKTFLALGACVVAVEPQKNCAKYLRWKFGNKINVINKGLGEKEGEKVLYVSPASVTSTFSEDFMKIMRDSTKNKENLNYAYFWNKRDTIKITTLESIIKEFGKPDFIKIDVEGFELEVLKGLNVPINVISFECHLPTMKQAAIECLDQIYKIKKESKFNYSAEESLQFYYENWLNESELRNDLDNLVIEKLDGIPNEYGDIYVRML